MSPSSNTTSDHQKEGFGSYLVASGGQLGVQSMNVKRLFAITTCLVLAVAAGWTFMVLSYETDLGTKNTILVSNTGQNATAAVDDSLVALRFDTGAEDLAWSSLHLSIATSEVTYMCSFGSQSTQINSSSLVKASLSADGGTFTTEIDATDEESFTHLDLPGQKHADEQNSTIRFSKTDAFLADDVRWAFVEDVTFQALSDYNKSSLSNQTEDRLEWYTYDFAEHRVQPNDGVYVIEVDGMMFKMKFLSYYNQDDESRHPTLMIAALNGTQFPALQDPELVIPSPCLIVSEDGNTTVWGGNKSITLMENGVQICDGPCTIEIYVTFETIAVDVEGTRTID